MASLYTYYKYVWLEKDYREHMCRDMAKETLSRKNEN